MDGSSHSHGYIIVRKDSDINTTDDMEGTVMAFVDKATVTGYLFPLVYFMSQGIDDVESFFSEFYFTGSHDSAVYAVLDGRADIGSVSESIYNALVAKDPTIGDELRIVARSPLIPESTLCIRKDLPKEIKHKIEEEILTLDRSREGQSVLNHMNLKGFVKASVDDFKPVYDMLNSIGKDIDTYQYRVK
jgi:phosphonate transport system substrate-binding protein